MRLAIVADCHIDHGTHNLWASEAWQSAIKQAAQREVDLFLIAGDLFRDGRTTGGGLELAMRGFRYLAKRRIPTVMVLGNHELLGVGAKSRNVPPAMLFNSFSGVTVVDSPRVERIKGLSVACLPWPNFRDPDAESQKESAGKLAEELSNETGPVIALGHSEIEECAFWGSEHDMPVPLSTTAKLADIDIPEVFRFTALGHIHQRQLLSPTCGYVGSTERFTFSDEKEERGFSIMEWDETERSWSIEFLPTATVDFRTYTVEEINLGKWGDAKPGTLVRVALAEGISESSIDRQKIEQAGFRHVATKPAKSIEKDQSHVEEGSWVGTEVEHLPAMCRWLEDQKVSPEVGKAVAACYEKTLGWIGGQDAWEKWLEEKENPQKKTSEVDKPANSITTTETANVPIITPSINTSDEDTDYQWDWVLDDLEVPGDSYDLIEEMPSNNDNNPADQYDITLDDLRYELGEEFASDK